jgi:hypothetical protein
MQSNKPSKGYMRGDKGRGDIRVKTYLALFERNSHVAYLGLYRS